MRQIGGGMIGGKPVLIFIDDTGKVIITENWERDGN